MAQQETAEILALNMLTWMAGNEEAMRLEEGSGRHEATSAQTQANSDQR